MSDVRNGLGHRVFWSGLALLLAASSVRTPLAEGAMNHWIMGAAFALFSAAWFMQPPVATRGLAQAATASAALSIGPAALRVWLVRLGAALFLLAFALRVISAA